MTFEEINPELDRMAADYIGGGLGPDGTARQLLPLFDMAALQGPPPLDRSWLLPDFIPGNEITLATGAGGAGKSLLAQLLCTCLADGSAFLGLPTAAQTALYVTAEDDGDELHRRQRNILRTLGGHDLSGKLFLSSLRGRMGNELVQFDRDGEMQRTNTFHILRDTIGQTGATFLVLDNLAHLFGGNENDRLQVTAFVNALYSLRRDVSRDYGERNLAILLIGHPNKSGDAYSGSTAWLNAVRSQVDLSRPDDAGHDPHARVLRLGKANYARTGRELRFRWHEGAFVRDEDLPPSVMAQIAEVGRINADDAAFLDCLAERNRQERPVSEHPSANYAPKVFDKMKESKGIGKQRLTDAMDRLFRAGKIERGFVCRDTVKRRDMSGLIVADQPPQTPAPNAPQTHAPDRTELGAKTAPNTHLYTTYISGAAPEGPPRPEYDPEGKGW